MTAHQKLATTGLLLAILVSAHAWPDAAERVLRPGWTTAALSTSRDVPPDLAFHIALTAGRSLMILGLGCALAVALAALTRALDSRVVLNLLVMLSAIPPLVWVPLSLTAFGLRSWAFDIPATLFVAALLAPALLQMAKRIPQGSVEMLVALGVPRSQILRQVLAPHLIHTAAPLVSLSYAVIFGVSAVLEYLGGFNGVGRALRLIAGYAEATDLLILTIVATAMLLLIQATIRLFLRALAAAL